MTHKTYTVIWGDELQLDVAKFWTEQDHRLRVELTRACDEIDRTLASAPDSVGRPWQGRPDQYLWSMPGFEFAIGVVYSIQHDDRIVRVARIHVVT